MRCIPEIVYRFESDAERKVHQLLLEADLGQQWVAFHSLNVSEHEYKKWSELDFVLLGPAGIFVLEVKGGRVKCEDGIWSGTNRFGVRHNKSQSPMEQAIEGMEGLLKHLGEPINRDLGRELLHGWGVVFPDISWKGISSPEIPREVICDFGDCASGIAMERWIRQLAEYWRGKEPSRRAPSDEDLRDFRKALRPDFDRVPALRARLNQIDSQMVSLTEEQYERLDLLDGNPQVLIRGGAGTGKTFLAMEMLRRGVRRGVHTAYLCLSPYLAGALRSCQAVEKNAVWSWSEVKDRLAAGTWKPVDLLIVDEGQDLLDFEVLGQLGNAVVGGIEKGKWWWFMDSNNQRGLVGNYDPEAEEYLVSLRPTIGTLTRNCRNTPQIVYETQLNTGADVGETIVAGIGPKVILAKISAASEVPSMLAAQLKDWTGEGIPLGEIAILSAGIGPSPVVDRLPERWRRMIANLVSGNASMGTVDAIVTGSVAHFKGLERKMVAIVDLELLPTPEEVRQVLYVGMTRAQAGLWIAVTPETSNTLAVLNQRYLPLLVEQLRADGGGHRETQR